MTLADFAADRRAPTPSAAAEISVPDGTQLPAILNRLAERSTAAMSARVEGRRATPRRGTEPWLASNRTLPPAVSEPPSCSIDRSARSPPISSGGSWPPPACATPCAPSARSPPSDRGYAVARRADGIIVRDPSDVTTGDALEVVVARGAVDTRVTAVRPGAVEELLS